LGQKFY